MPNSLLAVLTCMFVSAAAAVTLCPWLTVPRRACFYEVLGVRIPRPPTLERSPDSSGGVWSALRDRLRSPRTWRQACYHLVVGPAVNLLGLLGGLLWAAALIGLATSVVLALLTAAGVFRYAGQRVWGGAEIWYVLLSAALVYSSPWIVSAMVRMDTRAAADLLGPSRAEKLAQRVANLTESRAATVDAADTERRRIERDLHDGAQQRLVSLAMNLGLARATLAHELSEPARQALREAHEEAKEALTELRELVRGLHPVVLEDRGLDAAQHYYDSVLALYAQWGVDFIKADDMLWPYQAADIEAFAGAIDGCGRQIALSLSPGRDLSLTRLEHLREHATMWRICDDLWDRWEDVPENFARFARWTPHAGPQGWPDGDMLPLGRIGIRAERGEARDDQLTHDERIALMTLWVMARSPLMIGGDLPSSDPATTALFTNADVLEVHRCSTGNREVFREGPLVLWAAQGQGGTRYAAAFNLGETPLAAVLDTANAGLPSVLDGEVRELWTSTPLHPRTVTAQSDTARGVAPGSSAVDVSLPPHGAALLRYVPR